MIQQECADFLQQARTGLSCQIFARSPLFSAMIVSAKAKPAEQPIAGTVGYRSAMKTHTAENGCGRAAFT
ncbi:hypothetical protein [Erythrobacter westpacificensis]|uniref:hypothetical protein n=1 Tax=Erythrobacter westpacificensis TaxID=1055231 RepID=UPI0031F96863